MKHTIFGESHGEAIGVVLEGVPAGLALDLEAVQRELEHSRQKVEEYMRRIVGAFLDAGGE